jgi:peptidoglycan-associated lipoprotein
MERHTATALALFGALVAGCHKAPEPAPSPVTAFNADSARLAQARADSIARARASAQRESVPSAPVATNTSVSLQNRLTAVIHFDFDQATLGDQARATLDDKVVILRANPAMKLRIVGNTDDRGSEEYNLALGQRRAASARRYLLDQGIANDRIETTSYGESRPVALGNDESAWAQNRRDEFEVTSPAQTPR